MIGQLSVSWLRMGYSVKNLYVMDACLMYIKKHKHKAGLITIYCWLLRQVIIIFTIFLIKREFSENEH